MSSENISEKEELFQVENREWLESLQYIYNNEGPERVHDILRTLIVRAHKLGISYQSPANTPYINTIPLEKQPPFPGNREIERRIKSIIRWNAMVMVVRANRSESGIGAYFNVRIRGHVIRGRI